MEFLQQTTRYAPSGTFSADITVFKTLINITGCHGFRVSDSVLGSLDALAFHGNQGSDNAAIVAGGNNDGNATGHVICGNDVAAYNCRDGILASSGGTVYAPYMSAGKCTIGFRAIDGGHISAYGAIANGCLSQGFFAVRFSYIKAEAGCSLGNGSWGIFVQDNSFVFFNSGLCLANSGINIVVHHGSSARGQGASFHWSEDHGVLVQLGSYLDINSSYVTGNQGTGVYVTAQSTVYANSATITSNNSGGAYVGYNSYLSRDAANISSNTNVDTSPATIPSVGNFEGVIV